MGETFDVVIAGGGLAGTLLASRLNHAKPELRIKLLEKESALGGRLRTAIPEKSLWSYGLNFLTEDLFQAFDQMVKVDPDASDLQSYIIAKQTKIGLLSGSKLSEMDLKQFFTPKGARSIGGNAASRDWALVEEARESLASGKRKDQAFGSIWAGTKKSPAVLVLEQMIQAFGIPDLYSASAAMLFNNADEFISGRYIGNWEPAFGVMAERMQRSGDVSIQLDCPIVGAAFDAIEKIWTISARGGQFKAKMLAVTQSPWEAIRWLPKTYWPTGLLQIALKAKPVSCVCLSEVLDDASKDAAKDLPSVVFIPAENAHAIISPHGEVCYQTTIDFEVSLQAPDVVKAVKRLKRARRKLQAALNGLQGVGEHLALLSVAWSQPTAYSERRLTEKTEDRQMNSQTLVFAGDSYGRHCSGDQNLLRSVALAYGRITGEKIVVEEIPEVLADDADQETDERTDD